MARILSINPVNPQERLLRQVVEVLEKGGLIAYPTDTTYGIGCDIRDPRAIDRIYQLKSKDRKATLSFICSDLSHLADYAVVSNTGFRMMKRLLPGPYTFVLRATKLPPKVLQTRQRSVGIRVPDHPIPLELVRLLGHPVVNTTANVSGQAPFTHAEDILDAFGHGLDLIIDGGPLAGELSTVIEIDEENYTVLRAGKGMEVFQ
ncbi:MAG: L-threonylcarbamoyladenylate synthase [Nitrospirota bacterium]|nr:L-threonylcarbamoyladenylate synthase [Nitrospirota bacterium]